jgi:hypothetical protein
MAQFILLLRGGNEPYREFSEEEIVQAIQAYRQWAEDLRQSGNLLDAFKLADGGRLMQKRDGQIQVDGPFAETKETIGGYYQIQAETYDEAIEIAQACPIFEEGGTVEIRQIEE